MENNCIQVDMIFETLECYMSFKKNLYYCLGQEFLCTELRLFYET